MSKPCDRTDLRRRAEALASPKLVQLNELDPAEIRTALQELQETAAADYERQPVYS